MAETGRTWLPVVAHADPTTLVGEITLEDTLKARVRHLEEEGRRERILPLSAVVPTWVKTVATVPGRLLARASRPDRTSKSDIIQ
jgi:hypothetical protein